MRKGGSEKLSLGLDGREGKSLERSHVGPGERMGCRLLLGVLQVRRGHPKDPRSSLGAEQGKPTAVALPAGLPGGRAGPGGVFGD